MRAFGHLAVFVAYHGIEGSKLVVVPGSGAVACFLIFGDIDVVAVVVDASGCSVGIVVSDNLWIAVLVAGYRVGGFSGIVISFDFG